MSCRLESSIGDVSWLLRVSAPTEEGSYECLGLPPIASNDPILGLIWEQIAILHNGSVDDRSDAAASLVSLVRHNDRNGKLIIEEGGVGPLLKLIREGKVEGQENAVKAIGLLGRDAESFDFMINAGVFFVFAKILKEGPMEVQAAVAWAVSELVSKNPKCQDVFAEHDIVRLLVSHIAFETVQEHSHSSGIGNGNTEPSSSYSGININGMELEDSESKADMKAMAVKALMFLAKDNSAICRSLIESSALLCLAILLEKGPEEVKYNSALALKEITAVTEKDEELRRSALKSNFPARRAIVNQVIDIIDKEDKKLLIPCIKVIGSLARTFTKNEKTIVGSLVRLLNEREDEVSKEAADSLAKFACYDNYLHLHHSKAIISSGGVTHLVQLLYFGEQSVQQSALILLSYIALNVPDSEELSRAEVLGVLEWAYRQLYLTQDETTIDLLQESKCRLELYQSRGSRGFQN